MRKNQIVIVGAKSSGKTSILGRLRGQDFHLQRYAPTLGIICHKMTFQIDGNLHQAAIYDSQGFDNNPGIMFIPLFKRYTAFIIVYDITNIKSFQNAKQCIDQIRKLCPLENQYMLVLGNKDDLEKQRQVQIKTSMKYFDEEGIQFSQVSAKTSTSNYLKKLFENKLRLLIAKSHAENIKTSELRKQKKHELVNNSQFQLFTGNVENTNLKMYEQTIRLSQINLEKDEYTIKLSKQNNQSKFSCCLLI